MKILLVTAATALALAACADTRPTTTAARPTATVTTTMQAEPVAEVRDTQMRLQAAGFYNGPIDGVWGPETQAAVERYQQNRKLPVTGRIDEPTRTALRVPPATPVALTDPTDVRTVQNRLRQLNHYDGRADGVWGPSTQVAVESFQRSRNLAVGELNQATLSAMGLDPGAFPVRHSAATTIREPLQPGVVRGVQQRLKAQGYYNGGVDGRWGPRTEQALARFQRSRSLEPTGHLNPTTATALGLDPNNLSLSAVPR